MMSGASYIRIMPSAEQVAKTKPWDFGPNLQSVTLVRESTRFVRRTHRFTGVIVGVGFSLTVSSQTETVRSNEQVASTVPNSGCAHESRQTEPECAFQLAETVHTPLSFWSQILLHMKTMDEYRWTPVKKGVCFLYLNCLVAGASGIPLPVIVEKHIMYDIFVLRTNLLWFKHIAELELLRFRKETIIRSSFCSFEHAWYLPRSARKCKRMTSVKWKRQSGERHNQATVHSAIEYHRE